MSEAWKESLKRIEAGEQRDWQRRKTKWKTFYEKPLRIEARTEPSLPEQVRILKRALKFYTHSWRYVNPPTIVKDAGATARKAFEEIQ